MPRGDFVGLAGRLALLNVVRLLVASAGLGALAFVIVSLQSADSQADHSAQVLAQSNRIERSVIDLETGVRGFLLTDQRTFLDPTEAAESQLPGELSRLRVLVRGNPQQRGRAAGIETAIAAFRRTWVEPTLRTAGRVNVQSSTAVDKRKVDALRVRFAAFAAAENKLHANRAAHLHMVENVVLPILAAVLVLLLAATLTTSRWTRRRVIVPLTELQHALERFGSGALDARVNTDGFAEVGSVQRCFNVMADDLARITAELELQARTDGLTGLGNRRYFDEELERACATARRQDTPLSLLLLDIDDFKTTNDTLGHAAGDGILQTVARIYHSSVRGGDLVARIGGDEFAILLPNTPRSGADAVAATIRRSLADCGDYGGASIRISIGTATVSSPNADPDQIVHNADLEMYADKRNKGSLAA